MAQTEAIAVAPPVSTRRAPSGRRRALMLRALVTADLIGVALAAAASLVVIGPSGRDDLSTSLLVAAGVALLFVLPAALSGLYTSDLQHPEHSTVAEIVPIFTGLTIATWLTYLASLALGADVELAGFATLWTVAIVSVPFTRATARALMRRHEAYLQNTVIVGAGDVGQLIGRKLGQHPEFGIRLIGFIDPDPKAMRRDLDGVPVLGSVDSAVGIAEEHGVERAIVAFSNEGHHELLGVVRALQSANVQVDVVPRLFEAIGPAVEVHSVEGIPLVGLPPLRISRAGRIAKRICDVAVASTLIVLLSPLLALIALRIRAGSDGPVLFRQVRLGQDMHEFAMLKFRTMAADTDDEPHREYVKTIMDSRVSPTGTNIYKLERPDVVTKVGRWLRRTSLDELPQLFNVLRGDMSLVGPRPCMPYETELFAPHHFDRFLVPAGMTGLWQVSARASSTFVEALDLDVMYARNWSFWLDLSLLARTPVALVRGKRATS